jgi:hypothetical protein
MSRWGARPWFAYTQHDCARVLLAREDAGDRERAHQVLEEALATYRELGMMSSHAAEASRLRKRSAASGAFVGALNQLFTDRLPVVWRGP